MKKASESPACCRTLSLIISEVSLNVVFLSDDEDAAWVDAQPVSKHGPLFVGSGLVCIRETLC